MKKSKVLTIPTKVKDLHFDDDLYSDGEMALITERLRTQRWRSFKHEISF